MTDIERFYTPYLNNDANRLREQFAAALPLGHAARREQMFRYAEAPPSEPKRQVLTYGAAAREFIYYMGRRSAGIQQETGSVPTYSFGPLGISSDGVLISAARNANGQANIFAGHLDTPGYESDSWHGVSEEDGPIIVETDTRFRALSRAAGVATLSPFVQDVTALDKLYIAREVDIAAAEYQGAHPDAQVPPIGCLQGPSTRYPIFPLEALLGTPAP
jgi:hypothetical protein